MIAVATLQHLPRFCASRQDFYSEICEKKIVRCCNHRRSELAGVLHKFDDCYNGHTLLHLLQPVNHLKRYHLCVDLERSVKEFSLNIFPR